ncbi:TPA: hypothetical protein U2E41_001834 [Streptococcus suis]|nr:hypothetical protein [Streptococcus suis]HEM6559575.1 hypothetical protein [Streptococcus suis]
MSFSQNKGKSFLRAEVSKKQKEYISLLAELRGVSTQELLTQVVERFIDKNLKLIQDFERELEMLKNNTNKKIDMEA